MTHTAFPRTFLYQFDEKQMPVDAANYGVGFETRRVSDGLFCLLDGLSPEAREQKRMAALKNLGLLEAETITVFDEATQTAAHFVEAPVCYLCIAVNDELWLKSAVGLSRLGFMNHLAAQRKLPRSEAFCSYVIDSQKNFSINDTFAEVVFAQSLLAQQYRIRAYLGTPLVASDGNCLGALCVLDLVPREFSLKDAEFLALTARWCLRELERDRLLQEDRAGRPPLDLSPAGTASTFPLVPSPTLQPLTSPQSPPQSVKLQLLEYLSQQLKTPLTSVIGMASVLRRGVYGPLTHKQKEYIEIIYNSGQQMVSLVEEIVALGVGQTPELPQLAPIDLEMLCQQVLNSLQESARQRQQALRLSVEPGDRIWSLDKEKIRQALYYLLISAIDAAEAGGEVRVHVSRRNQTINIAVWVSHPWLGDGLPQTELKTGSIAQILSTCLLSVDTSLFGNGSGSQSRVLDSTLLGTAISEATRHQPKGQDNHTRELLGLLLSCHLIESHGGKIVVQGTLDSGYRYVLLLPKIAVEEEYKLKIDPD